MNTISKSMQTAIDEVKNNPRIVEIAKELASYNLGITIPHFHEEGKQVELLPENLIQSETNQVVTFIEKKDQMVDGNGFPVAWRFNGKKAKIEFCAWCCQN